MIWLSVNRCGYCFAGAILSFTQPVEIGASHFEGNIAIARNLAAIFHPSVLLLDHHQVGNRFGTWEITHLWPCHHTNVFLPRFFPCKEICSFFFGLNKGPFDLWVFERMEFVAMRTTVSPQFEGPPIHRRRSSVWKPLRSAKLLLYAQLGPLIESYCRRSNRGPQLWCATSFLA
mgnify:CR=1 FL=1